MFGSNKNFNWLIAGIVLFGLIGAGIYFYFQKNSANKETFENPKIAVIPFTNLSPDSETDYLGLAFSDELVKKLKATSTCEVIKTKELKPDEQLNERLTTLRTKNNVDFVLLGTYIAKENEIEITTKVISTFDNKTVNNKSFTVQNNDISTIPFLISNSIITNLHLREGTTRNFLVNPKNINPQAYQYYMKAAVLDGQDSKRRSIELIQKALEIEPDFYSCWILLTNNYNDMAADGLTPNIDYYGKATEAAKKAKEIDPNNPQAGMLLTTIHTNTGNLEEALREFKNLPKNDIDLSGRLRLGSYITRYGGLLDESIKLSKESIRTRSISKIFEPQLYYNGDYEGYKNATQSGQDPSFYSFFLGLTALYQNDNQAMRKHFQDGRTYFNDQFMGKVSQAILLQMDGKTTEGLKLLQEVEKSSNDSKYFDGETLYYATIGYAYLNDQEGVMRTFKKTVENGFFCYPYFLNDPIVGKYKDDARFQQILETSRQKHLKFKEIYYAENH